ncbi:MAG: TnpV protein [Defluviitaleaceae bacterium]|nr:TnpV protein [Defluviitaleaceae bacterium]
MTANGWHKYSCHYYSRHDRRKDKPVELSYTQVGDYLLPNIRLSESSDAPPLGKYDMMHNAYLKEHKPALYGQLLLSERLYPLCREVDEAAATRLRTIPDREVANEIILSELVYA